jgi:hypothetical protein
MKRVVLFFHFLWLCTSCLYATVENPKVLVLVIASDGTEAFIELQKIWRQYMNVDPEHFEVYFIRGNPYLPEKSRIEGENLFVKCEESYVPGITEKTILSMEEMIPRLHEFDFVLRTNLSSFFVFPRLLDFVKTLPRQRCYAGVQMYFQNFQKYGFVSFVSGAGIFLSPDLVEMLVACKKEIFALDKDMSDDVLFGLFFQQRGIAAFPAGRIDFSSAQMWLERKDSIPPEAFHFRAKSNYLIRSPEENFDDELFINKELLKMFYQFDS